MSNPSYRFRRSGLLVLAGTVLLLSAPAAGEAQGIRGRIGYGVGALSTPGWSPAYGPVFGVELGRWFGTGIHVEYRSAARDSGEIVRYCGFASCTDGPFDQDLFLRSLGLGFSRRLVEGGRIELSGVLRTRFFQQGRHLTHLETGEELDRDDVIDYGFGLGIEARSGPAVLGVHPIVWLAYDRMLQRECPADASCYHDRNHLEVGLGITFGR